MPRVPPVFAVLFLVGCGPGFSTQSDDRRNRPEAPTLTADQQLAWNKYRRAQDKPGNMVAACYHSDRKWVVYSGSPYDKDNDYIQNSWSENRGTAFDEGHHGDAAASTGYAEPVAVAAAKKPAIKVVAVVEMYGEERPVVAQWFWDNGSGVRKSPDAPFKEMEPSLRARLVAVQLQAISR